MLNSQRFTPISGYFTRLFRINRNIYISQLTLLSFMTLKRPAEVDGKIYDKFTDEAVRRLGRKGEPIKTALAQAMIDWIKKNRKE